MINKITTIRGTGVAIRGNDIDTDQIIPARYMKAVTFEGIEQFAFYDVRYNADGSKKDHPFNAPQYHEASILVVNSNFGCGSSREHAPQTLLRHGIKALIGESFAEIFAGNCTSLGMPIFTMPNNDIVSIQTKIETDPTLSFVLSVENSTVQVQDVLYQATIAKQVQNTLLQGTWDTTSVMLANETAIQHTYDTLPYINGFVSCNHIKE